MHLIDTSQRHRHFIVQETQLTNDEVLHHLQTLSLILAPTIAEGRTVLQDLASMVVSGLVPDVVRLAPVGRVESGDETSTPEREVVLADRIAGTTAGGLEGAEGRVGFDVQRDELDRLFGIVSRKRRLEVSMRRVLELAAANNTALIKLHDCRGLRLVPRWERCQKG